jgi:Tol biopolymer transport system component
MGKSLIAMIVIAVLGAPAVDAVAFASRTANPTEPTISRVFFSGCPGTVVDGNCRDDGGAKQRTELMSIAPDGTGTSRITTNTAYEQSPVWSPSKNTIAFSKSNSNFTCNYHSILALVDSAGSEDRELTKKSYRCDTPTDWSANGRKILYTQECSLCMDVYSIRPDGSRKRPLTRFYERNDPDIYAFGAEWLNETNQLLYSLNDYPERVNRLVLVNGDGTHKHPYGDKNLRGGDFDVSPSDEVAFVRYDEDSVSSLYVGDASGEHIRPVAEGFASGIDYVTWSPDGSKIAFVGQEDSGSGSLYVVNRDGTGLMQLDSPELDLVSTREIYGGYWSPDSSEIAFSAEARDYESHAVAVMNADGSDVRVLTDYERKLWVWGWEAIPE